MTPAQTRYTTTERELLAIVETLKEYRNILLGQNITVFTDHKNLTTKNFIIDRVMRWRLLLEEYGPELKYLEGHKNIVADALSRLNIKTTETELKDLQFLLLLNAECYADNKLPDEIFPLSFKVIQKHQQLNKELLREAKTTPQTIILCSNFMGAEK